jgi:hypothetical protein
VVCIVTCWPPDTDFTAIILLTTLVLVPSSVTDLYTQVLPTPIGNGTLFDDVVDVEPPDPEPELVLVLAAGLPVPAPLVPLFDGLEVPHAASASPAAARPAVAAPPRRKAG